MKSGTKRNEPAFAGCEGWNAWPWKVVGGGDESDRKAAADDGVPKVGGGGGTLDEELDSCDGEGECG